MRESTGVRRGVTCVQRRHVRQHLGYLHGMSAGAVGEGGQGGVGVCVLASHDHLPQTHPPLHPPPNSRPPPVPATLHSPSTPPPLLPAFYIRILQNICHSPPLVTFMYVPHTPANGVLGVCVPSGSAPFVALSLQVVQQLFVSIFSRPQQVQHTCFTTR